MVRWIMLLMVVGLLLGGATTGMASVEQRLYRTITVPGTPVDSVTSGDGSLLFVLTDQSKVYVYREDGNFKDLLEIEGRPDFISTSANGEVVYLTDKESGSVQIVSIDFVQEITVDGPEVKGDLNGSVTLAVFSDFQCPYCAKVVPLLDQVLAEFPKGVRVAFKYFPLSFHKFGMPAAMAAWAAGQQGKFWEMHDLIFANYSQLSDARFQEFAKQMGLDMKRFEADRQSSEATKSIQAHVQNAAQAGVRGTPALFVNGRLVKDRSLEGLKRMINKELKK